MKSLIKESVKEVLNENYRDPNENLDELLKLLNKNKTKAAIMLIQSVQSKLEDNNLEAAFDQAVEELLDKGNRGYFYDSSGRSLS